jgi:hypothetical protein
MQRTPEQIRSRGLAALKRELGVAGMLRFMQQFDPGSGNWAVERHRWLDQLDMDGLRKRLPKRPKKNKGSPRSRPL